MIEDSASQLDAPSGPPKNAQTPLIAVLVIAFVVIALAGFLLVRNILATAAYNNGNNYLDQKQYELAITEYNKAIKLNPKKAEFYNHRGMAYFHLSEYSSAMEDLNIAIELDPMSATAYTVRGRVYFELNQYELAINDLNMAIDLDPQNVAASECVNDLRQLV